MDIPHPPLCDFFDDVPPKFIDEYNARLQWRISVDYSETPFPSGDYALTPAQLDATQSILRRCCGNVSTLVVGRVGSICRMEVFIPLSAIIHQTRYGSFLIVVDDTIVPIAWSKRSSLRSRPFVGGDGHSYGK
jgi:hypothetical protein